MCKVCVVFPQPVHRGFTGAFISAPCIKYNDFHNCAQKHVSSAWHRQSQEDATKFLNTVLHPERRVDSLLDNAFNATISSNRAKLEPILSSIILCGTHDVALRGKDSKSGNLNDLLDFRIEAGDAILKEHMEKASGNAKYTSPNIQNELINLCEETVRGEIVALANNSVGFSILADETADISGTEQLAIRVRFFDEKNLLIREEFLGFTPLKEMDAETIAETIMDQRNKYGLNLNKLRGQGYDGCFTMAGKENGVQVRIKSDYPLAVFVHCSAHRLNLVVNDLNAVVNVRNTIGTVKAIIKFFRENPKRRPLVPNTPLLCETRWSAEYKSIRFFAENFTEIHKQLKHLALHDSNANGRQNAHNLRTASETPVFIVTLHVTAQYSSILEPVTQALQSVHVDMLCVKQHVDKLLLLFDIHRKNAEKYFAEDIYAPSLTTAKEIGVTVSLPRQCDRQVHRANNGGTTEEYYRRSIYVPYMDSLIQSLKSRFSETNTPAFALYKLHPAQLEKANRSEYKALVQTIQQTALTILNRRPCRGMTCRNKNYFLSLKI